MFLKRLFKGVVCTLLLLCISFTNVICAETLQLKVTASTTSLATPTGLQARASLVGAVFLKWDAVDNASGYILEYAVNGPNGPFMSINRGDASKNFFRHTSLPHNQTLYYRVKAIINEIESEYSSVVEVTTNPEGKVYKIMPLGDSNTRGVNKDGIDGRNRDITDDKVSSYRKELYKDLRNASVNFDFIGSEKAGEAVVKLENEASGDSDHAGFPGASIGEITTLLSSGVFRGNSYTQNNAPYLSAYNPDIILLHIGTNGIDGSSEEEGKLNKLLENIFAYEKQLGHEITVVLAKIIQRVCYDDDDNPNNGIKFCTSQDSFEATPIFNANVEKLALKYANLGEDIILVDMAEGANIDFRYYDVSGGDMVDPLHPTQNGYDKMATVWQQALMTRIDNDLASPDVFPVELMDFEARLVSNKIELHWSTATETNNLKFVVERMSEGSNFAVIGSIKGAGTSSIPQNYNFIDAHPPVGTLYYRLKQIDEDGTYSYSKVLSIAFAAPTFTNSFITYPNPSDGAVINYQLAHSELLGNAEFRLINNIGIVMMKEQITLDESGVTEGQLRLRAKLPPGHYILQVVSTLSSYSFRIVVN